MRIGYYVHHHGRGHATRAGVIGAAATARGHEVTYLGSGFLPAGDHVALTPDNRDADAPFVDTDAGGRLHWAPLGPGDARGGYAERATQIAAWVAKARPDVVVVDVSVEVAALVRLLGVPVVYVAQPGVRDDAPHGLAFGLAAAILAPWPEGLDVAPHLREVGERVTCVGGISRFAGRVGDVRARPDAGERVGDEGDARPRGALLVGGEGWDDPMLPDAVRAAVGDVAWFEPGPGMPIETLLARADVVVTHAGQNALADVACFEAPTVVVPQQRPFDEQADMAAALERAGIARGLRLGAGAPEIAAAVREVMAADADAAGRGGQGGDEPDSSGLGSARVSSAQLITTEPAPGVSVPQSGADRPGASWRAWSVDGAADRAVDVIEGAAVGARVDRPPSGVPGRARVAVVTPVRGRLDHLVNQRRFLVATAPEVLHVVVAVDSPDLEAELRERGVGCPDAGHHGLVQGGPRRLIVEHLDGDPLGMPTARARNIGAARALEAGADVLVFLDVDCAPLPGFVDALVAAQHRLDEAGERAVLNGVVTYLREDDRLDGESPDTARRFVDPHPARPAPDAGETVIDDDHRLLWSLAFALDADAWHACGGFDERYVGYGAEDTDFGMRAREAGLRMAWVGGAHALHQWHPSANPPVHHVVDIVRNATLYRERWGVWPMEGWLQAFADAGLVEWSDTALHLR